MTRASTQGSASTAPAEFGTKRRRPRYRRALVVAAVLAAFGVTACSPDPAPPPPPPEPLHVAEVIHFDGSPNSSSGIRSGDVKGDPRSLGCTARLYLRLSDGREVSEDYDLPMTNARLDTATRSFGYSNLYRAVLKITTSRDYGPLPKPAYFEHDLEEDWLVRTGFAPVRVLAGWSCGEGISTWINSTTGALMFPEIPGFPGTGRTARLSG